MASETTLDASATALKNIKEIFSNINRLSDKLQGAASLFRYISFQIDSQQLLIDVPSEVAYAFESICLWIRKNLPLLSAEIEDQITKILNESEIEKTIIALYTLNEDTRRKLKFRKSFSLISAVASAVGVLRTNIDTSTSAVLQEDHLQSTKIALGRLSGILDYAAIQLKDEEVEENLDSFRYKKHYDPKSVDKDRLLKLLEILEGKIEDLPDEEIKRLLVSDIDELKREVKRSRTSWKSFLGKAVLILAIIADIKTVHPEIGEEILYTVEAVIKTVVTGCQASSKNLPFNDSEDGPKHWAVETKRIEYRDESEEDK